MNKTLSLWLGCLALLFGMVVSSGLANAQQPDSQPPSQPAAQQPAPPDQAPSPSGQTTAPQAQPADPQAQAQPTDAQTFTGMIVKSGDKWVLQDTASGKTYDIDQQDVAKKYEGKQVRIQGTLDPDGKTIHVK